MPFRPCPRLHLAVWPLVGAMLLAAVPAQAQDMFFGLFRGFAPPPMMRPMVPEPPREPQAKARTGGGQAFCVRTCDGRYFPLSSGRGETADAACHAFCPAAETKVFYGNAIERAATRQGARYTQLAHAFRYRDELVSGCTCNGKSPGGLAAIDLDDDPTIRKGDIVVGDDGLMVANRGAVRRSDAPASFSPASSELKARLAQMSIKSMAAD